MQEYSYPHHHADDIRKQVAARIKREQAAKFKASNETVIMVPFRARCLPRLRSCA